MIDWQSSTQQNSTPQSQTPRSAAVAERARDLLPGQIVAEHYKVLSLIGRGGMGSVYKVQQIFLGKQLALKTIDAVAASDLMVRRFQREAQAASKLKHPNLVQAIDFGLIDGTRPFLVMEICEGQTLAEYLRKRGQLSVDLAVQLFIPICFAMAYAHQEGVIHRDIKPSNIVLVPADEKEQQFSAAQKVPKIVDFGIARIDEEGQSLTKTGEVFGTPLYMSPEQCMGAKVDHRCDIYSLGCVLYEALTGGPPFRGLSALETMMSHQKSPALLLKEASLGKDFPPALERIVARMLAKSADDRYQSFLEVAQNLVWLQQGQHELVQEKKPDRASNARTSVVSKHTIRLALSCILITIAAGWILLKTGAITVNSSRADSQSAATLKMQSGQTTHTAKSSDESITSVLYDGPLARLFPDEGFFSKVEGQDRTFTFPQGYHLGRIFYWKNGKELEQPALKTISVPLAAHVTFVPDETVNLDSYLLSLFRSGDLQGIDVSSGSTFIMETDAINRIVSSLSSWESLQAITLKHLSLTDREIDQIDSLPHLHWLRLLDCHVRSTKVASMRRLNSLQVLAFQSMKADRATPIIQQLALRKSAIRRLSIESGKVDLADLEYISRLTELTDLDLGGAEIAPPKPGVRKRMGDCLGKLSKLQRLTLSSELTGTTAAECRELAAGLSHLQNLQKFWHGFAPLTGDATTAMRRGLVPSCQLLLLRDINGDQRNGFDLELTDPVNLQVGR